jgi:5-methylcytosine-specific restriction endonuclease McrA
MSDGRKRVSLGPDPITSMVIWGSPEQLPPREVAVRHRKKRSLSPGCRWCYGCQAERPEAEFAATAKYCRRCLSVRRLVKLGLSPEQAAAKLEDRRAHDIGVKRCSKCRQIKLLADFKKDRADGVGARRSTCEACDKAYRTGYYARPEVRARKRARVKTPEQKRMKAEKALAYQRRPDIAPAARIRKQFRPGRTLVTEAFSAPFVFVEAWLAKEFNGRCCYCGSNGSALSVGRVVPLVKGGTNAPRNLAMVCSPCIGRKADKMPEEFIGLQASTLLQLRCTRMEIEMAAAIGPWLAQQQEAVNISRELRRISAQARAMKIPRRKPVIRFCSFEVGDHVCGTRLHPDSTALFCEPCGLHSRGLKVCSTCKESKAVSGFREDKRQFLGLQSQCRHCEKPFRKAREFLRRAEQPGRDQPEWLKPANWISVRGLIIEEFNSRCCYCGTKSDALTIDHVVPVSKGGTNAIRNLAPACGRCNGRKSDRPLAHMIGDSLVYLLEYRLVAMERKVLAALKVQAENHDDLGIFEKFFNESQIHAVTFRSGTTEEKIESLETR